MALKALKAKVRGVDATGETPASTHSRPLARNREADRDFVRGCVARLKQIELRLDAGCGEDWFHSLDSVDDLLGLAQQLEPLRKLTSLDTSSDGTWLSEICADGILADEHQSELSRRLLRHLDDVDRAVPPMRAPHDMLGESILKYFDGHGIFMGTIVEFDEHTGFRLQYDDGDTEDVSLRDLRGLMPTNKPAAGAVGKASVKLAGKSTKVPPKGGGGASAKATAAALKPVSRQPSDNPTPAGRAAAAADMTAAGGSAKRSLDEAGADTDTPAIKLQTIGAAQSAELRDGCSGRGVSDAPAAAAAIAPTTTAATAAAVAIAAVRAGGTLATPAPAADPAGGAGGPNAVSLQSLPAVMSEAELAQLPPGWMVEAKGKAKVFVSPDGLTRLSTIAKVQRWHRQQMALAARFAAPVPAPETPAPALHVVPPTAVPPSILPVSPGKDKGGERRSPRSSPRAPPSGQPSSIGGIPAAVSIGSFAATSAAALAQTGQATGDDPRSSGGSGVKKLPRELRNLAIPDRDWKDLLPPKQAEARSATAAATMSNLANAPKGSLLYVAGEDRHVALPAAISPSAAFSAMRYDADGEDEAEDDVEEDDGGSEVVQIERLADAGGGGGPSAYWTSATHELSDDGGD